MGAAMQRLRAMAGESRSNLVSLMEAYVRESPDVELAHIRPFAVARQWQQDKWEVLRVFLLATRAGLLDLSWEVLCPNCRSTREPVMHSLSDVKPTAHCEVCQIQFNAEFDKSVELKFTVNLGIKSCEEKIFCLAGPGAKPHVVAQVLVPPQSSRELKLPADHNGIRIRSPQVNNVIQRDCSAALGKLVCGKESFLEEEGAAKGTLQLINPNSYAVTVLCERIQWSEDILTAARITNLQEFRDLFSTQVISPSEQIVVGQQIILFTDLRGSTAMYCGIGDAPAYAVVRDHFAVLRDAIRENRGAIVKTIGDAVMAVFSDVSDSLNAVRKMHLSLTGIPAHPDQAPLKLKSSLHLGPCLAVNANERLDYFGTTINLAARLVDSCTGGDLTISDDFYNRPQTQSFLREHGLKSDPAEMRFRGFDTPTKLWRIPFVKQ
jgi:class 3 adenylate cyclase